MTRGVVRVVALALALGAVGCDVEPRAAYSGPSEETSPAVERATRRAFDGAPPVIPHTPFPSPCIECHNERGMSVEGVGFSPPSPHERTAGMSETSRCRQCHVFKSVQSLFRPNQFVGLRQDLRPGPRQHRYAPPVIPHLVLMRENCQACHTGPAAREEIRTTHPERGRCRQCHLEKRTVATFRR